MAYSDVVLKQRPAQYYTLSNNTGSTDLSGAGNTFPSYTAGPANIGIVPKFYYNNINTTTMANPAWCFSDRSKTYTFNIDFWHHPGGQGEGEPGRTFSGPTNKIIASEDGLCYLEYLGDSYVLTLQSSTGDIFYATAEAPDWNRSHHVSILCTSSSAVLIVDGISGDITSLGDGFLYPDNLTPLNPNNTLSVKATMISNLSIFDRQPSAFEIIDRYNAGTYNSDYQSLCIYDGAIYNDLSKNLIDIAQTQTINFRNWQDGNFRNIIIDKNNHLSMIRQPNIRYTDYTSNYTPSYSSGITIGSGKFLLRDSLSSVFSANKWIIGITADVLAAPSASQIIFTIADVSSSTEYSWYVTTAGALKMTKSITDAGGSTTTTDYTYATGIVSNTSNKQFWIEYDSGSIYLSHGSGFNQVSSSDFISEIITLDEQSLLLFGSNTSYSGSALTKISSIYFYNYEPTSDVWDGTTYSSLATLTLATCAYLFSSNLAASQQGEWTYTTNLTYNGPYFGSNVYYDMADDGNSKVQFSYDGGAYTDCRKNYPISSMPTSGTLDSANVKTLKVKVTQKTDNSKKYIPTLGSIIISLFLNSNLNTNNSSYNPIISSAASIISPRPFKICDTNQYGNVALRDSGSIEVPILHPAAGDSGYSSITSSTSTTIGTGLKTLAVLSQSYAEGERVRAYAGASSTQIIPGTYPVDWPSSGDSSYVTVVGTATVTAGINVSTYTNKQANTALKINSGATPSTSGAWFGTSATDYNVPVVSGTTYTYSISWASFIGATATATIRYKRSTGAIVTLTTATNPSGAINTFQTISGTFTASDTENILLGVVGLANASGYDVNQFQSLSLTTTGSADPNKYIEGAVDSTSTSTSLVINSDTTGGSGTVTSWNIVPASYVRSIEFLFTATNDISTSYATLLCGRDTVGQTDLRVEIKRVGSNMVIKNTGFSSLYIDGVSIGTTETTISAYSLHHLVATITDGINTKIYLNAQYDGTSCLTSSTGVVGYMNMSLYKTVLSSTQVTNHFQTALGGITASAGPMGPTAGTAAIGIYERPNFSTTGPSPLLYSHQWQM